jgi:SAM-dependent methyltransferase
MRWDPEAYGEAFADVYDEWYAARGDEAQVVARLATLAAPHGPRRLLELGVGTGRLAIPLAADGWSVVGLDSSPGMLDRLRAKAGPAVGAVLADAADPTTVPAGPFEVVLAAFNFLCNLPDRAAQARCLAAARAVVVPDGVLVVEAFVPDPQLESGRVESFGPWTGVRIIAVTDADAGVVEGEHVEADGRRRPWRVCLAGPATVDELANDAGWTLADRTQDWAGTPFAPDASPTHVSVYRAT